MENSLKTQSGEEGYILYKGKGENQLFFVIIDLFVTRQNSTRQNSDNSILVFCAFITNYNYHIIDIYLFYDNKYEKLQQL